MSLITSVIAGIGSVIGSVPVAAGIVVIIIVGPEVIKL